MACILCNQNSAKLLINENSCIDIALESIRQHFSHLKNIIDDKDKKVQALQTRNDKLVKAVELLQRKQQQQQQQNSVPFQEDDTSITKRRKTSSLRPENDFDRLSPTSESSITDDAAVSPRLNTALNSEQLLDMSTCSSPRTEAVAGTEKIKSPRVFRTPTDHIKRRGARKLKLNGLKSELKSPPIVNPKETLTCDSTKLSEWKTKEKSTFTKDNDKNVPNPKRNSAEKQSKESVKLKQTTLQFEVPNITKGSKTSSTFLNNPIDERPQTSNAAKLVRDWIDKCDKSAMAASSISKTHDSAIDSTDITLNCLPTPEKLNDTQTTAASGDQNSIFELRLDLTPEKKASSIAANNLLMLTTEKPKISSSCILLSPPPPEIVFLDDSIDENSDKTMDLIENLMKNDDECWLIPKHDNAKKMVAPKKPTDSKPISKPPKPLKNSNKKSPEQASYDPQLRIKEEKLDEVDCFNESDSYSDDLMREVKVELLSENVPPPPKLNIKERFNVDCVHCQKYIDFLNGQLTDKEIEEHLRKCTRHKERDALRNCTPEDFWNPLLQSFAEDDPRNEVLIDARFADMKRCK